MLLVINDLDNYLPYGLSLLVIIVVALFICMLTLAVGLAYMHRHRSNSSVRSRSTFGSKHRQLMTSSSTYALAPTTCTVIQPGTDATDVVMTTTTCPTSQNVSPVKSNTLPTRLGPHAIVLPADGVIVSGVVSGNGPGSCSSPTQRRVVHVNFSPRTAPRCLEHARHTFDDEVIACVNRPIVDAELTEPWLQQQHPQRCGGCCSASPNNAFGCSDHTRKCTCTGGADHLNVTSSPIVNSLHQQCLHPTAILDLPPPPPPPTLPKPPTTLMFTTFKPVPPIDSWDDSNISNVSVADEWNKTARSPTAKMRISKDVMKPKN